MLDIIGAFWEQNWLSGGKVENVLGIISAFWEKNWLSGLWYQDQNWLSAKTSIFGQKSRKRCSILKGLLERGGYYILGLQIQKHARYHRRVMREKLTFGGKSRKLARYNKRILREKLTFKILISISTSIIGQNSSFLPKKSKTCSIS